MGVAQEFQLFESFDEAIDQNHIHLSFDDEKSTTFKLTKEKIKLKKRYNNQRVKITNFQHTLYRVRRLLANIPTYMVFDDHEITDDWNLSATWKSNVQDSPLGKHVVSNGLAAYWAFQGWGNNPDAFDDAFTSNMKEYFSSLMSGNMMTNQHNWSDLLWNYDKWHFIAPTSPKAVFLDTRTQREYNFNPRPVKLGGITMDVPPGPQLVNESEWADITKQLNNSSWNLNHPLIIVSATPFYGLGLIESFLHDYVFPLKALGMNVHTTFDLEAWRFNSKGFTNFLRHVAGWSPNPCIILSGDAHYASSVDSQITFKNGQDLNVKQFTSSPLKNMSFTSVCGLLLRMVIEANGKMRISKDIYRYCDESYHIQHTEDPDNISNHTYLWKDRLRYQSVINDSIIETDNNLGLLSLSSQSIENRLLKMS